MTFSDKRKRMSPVTHLMYIVFFGAVIFFASLMQCSSLTVFGITPDITFSLVCAIGFIVGEKYGGIFGLFGGLLITALGSGEISFSPILYTVCGYLCGVLPNLILRRNFLSYLVYTPIMGAVHIFFSVMYLFLLSKSYEIWSVIGKRILPELFSCMILMIAAYGVIFLIYKLFKGKRNNK